MIKIPSSSNRCVTALLAALLSCSADARQWECGERSNLPIEGRTYCAAGDFRQTENTLRKVLAAVANQHATAYGDGDALLKSQRAFETYRDAQCQAELKRIEAKPFHGMLLSQCKSRRNTVRIDELEAMKTPPD